MNDYNITDYSIFTNACATTKTYINDINTVSDAVKNCNNIISDEAIFMGPIADNCKTKIGEVSNSLSTFVADFTKINDFIIQVDEKYQSGDAEAAKQVLQETEATTGTEGSTSTAETQTTTTPDAVTGASPDAIDPHSRISDSERKKRINYLGGLGSKSEQENKMKTITVPYWDGSKVDQMRLTVNSKLEQNYYNAFKELADMHYTITPKTTGAYNYRKNTSGKRISDHALGSCVDVNWDHNDHEGDGSSYSVRGNEKVINAFAKQGFYWGGDWNSWHDDMHFSWTGW